MSVDIAVARAELLAADDGAPGAARLLGAAIDSAPPGNAGWLVPIERRLGVQSDRAPFASFRRSIGTPRVCLHDSLGHDLCDVTHVAVKVRQSAN